MHVIGEKDETYTRSTRLYKAFYNNMYSDNSNNTSSTNTMKLSEYALLYIVSVSIIYAGVSIMMRAYS